MADMFCFQCQQTAGNKGCVVTGVCGKQPETALLQDELVYELISLSKAVKQTHRTKEADRLVMEWFFHGLSEIDEEHTPEKCCQHMDNRGLRNISILSGILELHGRVSSRNLKTFQRLFYLQQIA